ncbi:hypothetical protein J2741_001692 [Methanolinea mesophila]|uniref:hypothetical protein n=1 Tax=Methanolinea mesophila TaxID=547055 RepID=UPI001AE4A5B8|nr:hypothetical protein [Methanolinea mesophila]MBP1929145.1 hypothetical protein [Methanolinea mesophila]
MVKTQNNFVLIFLLVVILFYSGCVSLSERYATPSETPTISATHPIPPEKVFNPIYSSGDIINDVKLAYTAYMVYDYNNKTDSYGLVQIQKYAQNNSWGYVKEFKIETKSRKIVEDTYMFKVGHVNADEMLVNYGQMLYNTIQQQIDTGVPKYSVGDIAGMSLSSGSYAYLIILEYTPESDKYTTSMIHKKMDGSWGYYAHEIYDGTTVCEYNPESYGRKTMEKMYPYKMGSISPNNAKCDLNILNFQL